MRRSEAPYAAGAALVLLVSLAVLVAGLAAGGLLEERLATDATPSASASRPPIELSRTGRLAYWRTDPAGVQLWVSNIDGSNRRALAKIDSLLRVETTRWSPDGNAIAYVDRGQAAVVIRLDGARSEIALPQALAASGNARLVDLAWSTDSALLAATVRNAASPPNTDVYVAAATGGAWRSATSLGNAFLSQWISPTEILIHTGTGLIAIQRADGTDLTPLTAQVATSPFVADDGRIYYLAGQVAPTIRDATVPVLNAAQASVWSMTADGDDIRQEIPQRYDDVRLAGLWSPGRFVAHVGASTSLAFLQSGLPPLASIPGIVDRVVLSPDRRTAIGVNSFRIYRYDVARPESPVVLLSDVAQPDAWYPQTVTLARASPHPGTTTPSARYAFALHGLVWATDAGGVPHLVRKLDSDDRSLRRLSGVAVPQWSPRGDRILYFDVLANSFRGAVFVTDVSGTGMRLSDRDAAGTFPAWTPEGNVAYTDLLNSSDSAGFGANGEVRIVAQPSGARIATYSAREMAFGGGKAYVIDNGRLDSPFGYADHAIVETSPDGTTRTVTNAAFLNAGLPFSVVPGGSTPTGLQLSMLSASADGAFLSARISPSVGSSVDFTFAIFRASDGRPIFRLPGQAVADVRWSPNGHLVGMTIGDIPSVRDGETFVTIGSAGRGRFAGWSPDGKWFYVARETGLYAIPLAGGEPVRVLGVGVPVSTTP